MSRVHRGQVKRAICLAIVAATAVAGSQGQGSLTDLGVQTKLPERFTERVVASGLLDPWEVLWGPDGKLWVTERSAKQVVRIDPATGAKSVLVAVPDAYRTDSQDGVLGLALHPGLASGRGPNYVYVSFVYDGDPGPDVSRRLALRRYTYDSHAGTLGQPVDLLRNLPSNDDHAGGRLAMGPDQKLYLTVGDLAANHLWNACSPNHAQDLPTAADVRAQAWAAYQGKILRINLDGSIPADNPVLAGVRSHTYSYGHRNSQGLAFGPDGKLYASEHGPATDDELNLIEAGKNYGWPYVAGYRDDRAYRYANWSASAPTPCAALRMDSDWAIPPPSVPRLKETAWNDPDFRAPLRTFFTVDDSYPFATADDAAIAPSGIEVYSNANGIPGWANSVLMTSLTRGCVLRLKLDADGTSVVGPAMAYFASGNRYRDLAISPDGLVAYVATDRSGSRENPGAILAFSFDRPGLQSR